MDEKISNVQLYPGTQRVELNDKATKILFNLTAENYAAMIQKNLNCGVVEKKNHKKHGKIKSTFKIENENGYTQIVELSEFDRAVFGVCISEYLAGNQYTTPAIILRALTGKVGKADEGVKLYPEQRTAILQSIDKMMCTLFDPDVIDAFEKLNYDNGTAEKIVKAPLLPCKRVQKTINGQKADVIYFTDESPLLKIAQLKGQILRYDVSLLDVPKQNNTPLIITLKNYILRRVMEIKKHKMTPTLTFDDIFKKARITDKPNVIKLRARGYIVEFFEHLQAKGEIKSFELTKKGNKFYSIFFTF